MKSKKGLSNMKIALGCDHGGYLAKEEVKKYLTSKGYEVKDVGTYSTESTNYAEYGLKAAELVASKECELGVVICSSGEGISIAANKVKGIRCGIAYNDTVAGLIRQHNNCNMIAFGAKFMETKDILHRIDIFLATPFEGGRHVARINTITDYEDHC